MKWMVLLSLLPAAALVVGCTPKMCDPQPMPEAYQEVAGLLPASSIVCGLDEKGTALQLNFREKDIKLLGLETAKLLTAAGWTVAKLPDPATGQIRAWKGQKREKKLQIGINTHAVGPNAGRITGHIFLSSQ